MKKPKCDKDAKHYHKALWELTDNVRAFVTQMDVLMKQPSTVERGKRIAALMNELEMANDRATYFGMGVPFRQRKSQELSNA